MRLSGEGSGEGEAGSGPGPANLFREVNVLGLAFCLVSVAESGLPFWCENSHRHRWVGVYSCVPIEHY